MWCKVLSRNCLHQSINLLQRGLDQGLVSVHITEASIPGAAHPAGAFMNNWCCSDRLETPLFLYFYMKAITVLIDIYAAGRSETIKCICCSFRGSLFALSIRGTHALHIMWFKPWTLDWSLEQLEVEVIGLQLVTLSCRRFVNWRELVTSTFACILWKWVTVLVPIPGHVWP